MFARRWLTQKIIAYLTRTLPDYERRTVNDLRALKARIRPADVLLVQGEQRVSAIIRYLTQSSWSHAAIYIGDALLREGGEAAGLFRVDQLREQQCGRCDRDRELVEFVGVPV